MVVMFNFASVYMKTKKFHNAFSIINGMLGNKKLFQLIDAYLFFFFLRYRISLLDVLVRHVFFYIGALI